MQLIRPRLVRMRPGLLPRVTALEAASYPADEAATADQLAFRCAQAPDFFWVCLQGGMPTDADGEGGDEEVVGFVCGTLTASDELHHDTMSQHDPRGTVVCIHSVVVAHAWRGRGVASWMLRRYMACVGFVRPDVTAYLLLAHDETEKLYLKAGFTRRGLSSVVHGTRPWWELAYRPPGRAWGMEPGWEVAHIQAFVLPGALQRAMAAAAAVGSGAATTPALPNPVAAGTVATSGNGAAIVFLPTTVPHTAIARAWDDNPYATASTPSSTGGDGYGVRLPTPADMQATASYLRQPVTVFVVGDERGRHHVRFYTPTASLAFCGHGALAACVALSGQGWIPPSTLCNGLVLVTAGGRHVPCSIVPNLLPDAGDAMEAARLALSEGEVGVELVLPAAWPTAPIATLTADATRHMAAALALDHAPAQVHVTTTGMDGVVMVDAASFAGMAPPTSAATLAAISGTPCRILSVSTLGARGGRGVSASGTSDATAAAVDAGVGPLLCSTSGYRHAPIPLAWFDVVSRCFPTATGMEDAACGAAHCGIAPTLWRSHRDGMVPGGGAGAWSACFQASPRGAVLTAAPMLDDASSLRLRGAGRLFAAGCMSIWPVAPHAIVAAGEVGVVGAGPASMVVATMHFPIATPSSAITACDSTSLIPPPRPLTLQVLTAGGVPGGDVATHVDNTGFYLWRACCNTLSAFLVHHPSLVAGKTVVELGAGLALPTAVAAALGARAVLATDSQSPVLPLAEHNIAMALAGRTGSAVAGGRGSNWPPPPHPTSGGEGCTSLPHAARLRWGSSCDMAHVMARYGSWLMDGGGVDVVLASDVLWLKSHVPDSIYQQARALFHIAAALLHRERGVMLLTYQTRAAGMLGDVWDAAHESGLAVTLLQESECGRVWPSHVADSLLDGTSAAMSTVRLLLISPSAHLVGSLPASLGVEEERLRPDTFLQDPSHDWLIRHRGRESGDGAGVGEGGTAPTPWHNPLWKRG